MSRVRRPRHPVHLARQVAALVLLLTALLVAVRPPPEGAAAPRPSRGVVTATHDLVAGSVLTEGDLRAVRLDQALVPSGAQSAVEDLVGRSLAAPVRAGEVLTDVRLVGPALWSQAPPGQVAAPVRLADLAVTALLRAGDRVDVLATPPDGGGSTVIAPAALVLATPTRSSEGADQPGGEGAGLVVLAVDPATAAALATAAATATLTVTLGPIAAGTPPAP